MIPNSFDYHRPDSVDDAVKLLAQYGEVARPIAGGHSLIPMMKLRMTDIQHLVDLQAIGDLKGITVDGGTVTIGAMTTQHDLIASDALAAAAPIVREAALQIADPQVRFRATSGGYAYEKQKRKIGDYATAAAAVLIETSGGTCSAASIAMTNLSDTPVYCADAVAALVGSSLDKAALDAAVAAMLPAIDPQEDNRGPVEFKKHVAGVVLRRAIERAASRA